MTGRPLLADLAFANSSWVWVVLLFGGVGMALLGVGYRRSPLRGGLRVAAVTLKALGLALLALALLEPVHLDKVPKRHSNEVALLADNSAGLTVALGGGQDAPAEVLRTALGGTPEAPAPAWIENISRTFRVQSYLVDRGLRQVDDFSGLDFANPHSALGSALENLAIRFRGRPLAATVLLTDGNATDAAALEAYVAAQETRPEEERVPVFPVLVGRLDPSARDLAVARVEATTTQFEDAQVTLQVTAEALGDFPGPVEVFVLNESDTEIGKKDLVFPPGTKRRSAPVRLRLSGVGPGVSFLTVGIRQTDRPLAQLTDRNDRLRVSVNRGTGPYRILYLSGRPNWEFKFLRRAIAGDAELDLVGLVRIARREPKFEWRGHSGESSNPLFRGFNRDIPEEAQRYDQPVLVRLNTASPGELRDGFPKTAEELFTHYRAILIDDLEAEFFTAEQQELIDRFVAVRGGTVVMLGGQESFQEGGWDQTPTGRLLPVYLDRKMEGGAALEATYNLTREGWLEDWMRLRTGQDDEETRLAYMPPFFAVNRIPAIKPGASILSTVSDGEGRTHPAVVTQRYGAGRSAAVTVADFWRWGMKDAQQQAELGKMWRQFLRWSVTDVPSRVEVTHEEADVGAVPVTRVSVRVRDLGFNPQDDATVRLTVKDLDGTTRELAADPSLEEPGLFTAEHLSEGSSGYRIEVQAVDGEGREIGTGVVARALNAEAAEFARLGPDSTLLDRLAQATGGKRLSPDELGDLPGLLDKLDLPVVELKQRPLWHTPWIFLLALACFLGEWFLRRRRGLI